jgi:DNA-binding transcriptional MerR regulator
MEENVHSESVPEKDLFRIGEVSRLTATKAFVLRYWETEFPILQPVKSPKGHRLYRRQDIDTVFLIKRLLYDEGFTIAGARRHLLEQNGSTGAAIPEVQVEQSSSTLDRKALLDLRDALRSFLTLLEGE